MKTDTTDTTNVTDGTDAPDLRLRLIRASGALTEPPLGTAAATDAASTNRLLQLPDEDRARLFAWLRDCPYESAVKQLLSDEGIEGVTSTEISDFFQIEADTHWYYRLTRATEEANALIRLAEKNPTKFSGAILTALGQEAFRQVASGAMEPQAMGRLATLFLRARSDERADQMQELKREKLRNELHGQVNQALEELAQEVERHPKAREAFEALRLELSRKEEDV